MAPRIFSSPPSINRLSAVYIGPAHIPDLPGPPSPSPSSSSSKESASGLPSPPATNSTGSGGDSELKEKEEKERALPPPPPSPGHSTSALDIHNRRGHKLSSSISSVASVSISSVIVPKGASILEETLPLAGMDDEEEDTARVNTLQRVKSLKDRNRLVLDKLVRSGTQSPAPSTSSSSSRHSHSQTMSPLSMTSPHSRSNSTSSPHNDPRSGSETERESTYSRASSTHHRAFSLATSTPQHEQLRPQTHRSSVPSTPSARNESRSRGSTASGSGSSSRRRMRLAMLDDGTARLRERAEEILDRTRRDSPSTSAAKKRGALPAEFRKTSTEIPQYHDSPPLRTPSLTHTASHSSFASTSASQSKASSSRYSLDLASHSSRSSHSRSSYSHAHSQSYSSSSSSHSQAQSQTNTPNHNNIRTYNRTHTPSPSASTMLPAPTPRAPTSAPRSTAASTVASRRAAGTPVLGMAAYRERRQTLRGGSAESALSNRGLDALGGVGKRTLIGEGLRAAGLSPSRSRSGRGRLSLGWEAEEETAEARALSVVLGEEGDARAVTSLSVYERERERGARVREMSLVRDRERERRREERERERTARERERELRERDRSLSRVRDVDRDRELVTPDREQDRDTTYTPSTALIRLRTATNSSTTTATTTAATPSPFGSRRHAPTGSIHSQSHTEHTRLLGESLNIFEGHIARLGVGVCGDTVKNAQSVVGAAARLNEMLRGGTARALEEQVRAEVEGTSGREEEMWGRVGAEYREGLKMSDELVRGLTGLLLGLGRVVRELGGGEGTQHARSVSLDEEGLVGGGHIRARGRGSLSPDVSASNGGGISALVGMGIGSSKPGPGSSGAGSGGTHSVSAGGSVSGSGRRSVESRRSWDANATLALRDEVSRRLVARAESALGGPGVGSRPGTAFSILRERARAVETPPQQGTRRRLFTPREQREMQMSAGNHTPGSAGPGVGGMPTIHSQETLYGEYEPSPTPASRTTTSVANASAALDRSRALPPLGIPKPLPSLPSETALRRNGNSVQKSVANSNTNPDTAASAGTVRDRERDREMRKVSSASTSTVRGGAPTSASGSTFPVTAPAGATTAVTAHTVSTQQPDRTAFPSLPRTDSDRSVRSSVTFSRASTVSSVSALADVRWQDTRRRTESGNVDPSASDPLPPACAAPAPVPVLAERHRGRGREREREVQSGSETERPRPLRMQPGKMTLDAKGKGTGSGHARDRSAVVAANAIVAAKMGISGGRGSQPNANGVGVAKKERRRTITEIWPQE